MAAPALDLIADFLRPVLNLSLPELHLHIEIPLRLEIIAQVGRAFGEKILVHRPLLEHRHVLAQLAAREAGARRGDLHRRARVHRDPRLAFVRGAVLVDSVEHHGSEQPVLVLVFQPQTVDPVARPAQLDPAISGEQKPVPMRRSCDGPRAQYRRVSRNLRHRIAGSLARLHDERDVHLLVCVIVFELRSHLRVEISVLHQQFPDILHRLRDGSHVKRIPQPQARGVHDPGPGSEARRSRPSKTPSR